MVVTGDRAGRLRWSTRRGAARAPGARCVVGGRQPTLAAADAVPVAAAGPPRPVETILDSGRAGGAKLATSRGGGARVGWWRAAPATIGSAGPCSAPADQARLSARRRTIRSTTVRYPLRGAARRVRPGILVPRAARPGVAVARQRPARRWGRGGVDLLTRRAGAPGTGHAWRGRPEGRGRPCSQCTAGWCSGPPRPERVRRGHRWPAATAADPECQPAARCARAARPRPCRDACSKRTARSRDERRSCRGVP